MTEQFNPLGFGQVFTTPAGATRPYGFTNTYQPSPQAQALGRIIDALQDPRNGWMGLGMIRGLGTLRGRLFQPSGRDMGGFNVPTKKMRGDMGFVDLSPQFPVQEAKDRQIYLNAIQLMNNAAMSGQMSPGNRFVQGQRALQDEIQREQGGQVVTTELLRRLGFGQ